MTWRVSPSSARAITRSRSAPMLAAAPLPQLAGVATSRASTLADGLAGEPRRQAVVVGAAAGIDLP